MNRRHAAVLLPVGKRGDRGDQPRESRSAIPRVSDRQRAPRLPPRRPPQVTENATVVRDALGVPTGPATARAVTEPAQRARPPQITASRAPTEPGAQPTRPPAMPQPTLRDTDLQRAMPSKAKPAAEPAEPVLYDADGDSTRIDPKQR